MVQGFTLRSKKQLLCEYSQGNKVLDYGAGKGDFTNYLHKSGFDITGYEPDQGAREMAVTKHGAILQESIDIIPNNSLDAVTMWHVLEHIPNPNEIIQQLLLKLKKTAVMVVAVPNYQSFDASHYKEFWAAYDVPRHVTHYEQSSMSFLMNKNGLKIIQTKPMLFDSTYVSLLSEKYRTIQTGNTPGVFNQLKATIIGLISNIALMVDKNRCSSIIYIIKRQ
jgi:2-polyprenyl-3-methyl-5-hydroxy-6-metoxy-1,4-benzoquinol methylase